MSDRRSCVRCNRSIDSSAKACPFCSWDQSETPPPPVETSAAAGPVYIPPEETFWRNRILAGIAFVALLVIAFGIGALVHSTEPSNTSANATTTTAPVRLRETAAPPPSPSSVELVPAGNGGNIPIEQPLTSAPASPNDGSMANPYARDDATALPQSDYAHLAQRAQVQPPSSQPQFVDPRSIATGQYSRSASGHSARAQATPSMGSPVSRTEPVAVYQPVPSINVGGDATARLLLTVGADGRVKDIDIARAIPGDTARLIGAVQEWRFRPATENGVPVASRFSVDITFHGNE